MSKGFFQDSNGDKSMIRLLAFMVALVSCACLVTETVFWCMNHKTVIHFAELALFIAPAFFSKVAQKIAEKYNKT